MSCEVGSLESGLITSSCCCFSPALPWLDKHCNDINDCSGANSSPATTLQWLSSLGSAGKTHRWKLSLIYPGVFFRNSTFYCVAACGWATRAQTSHTITEAKHRDRTRLDLALISQPQLCAYITRFPHPDRRTNQEVSVCLCIYGVTWLNVLLFTIVLCLLVWPWHGFPITRTEGLKIFKYWC